MLVSGVLFMAAVFNHNRQLVLGYSPINASSVVQGKEIQTEGRKD